MSELLHTDAWEKMLQKGVILWRHCSFPDGEVVLEDVLFEPTKRSNFVAKLRLSTGFIWEPEVLPKMIDNRSYTRGIVLFVDIMPPARWTHLILSGVSNTFTRPGKQEMGGYLFAKMTIPLAQDDYLDFRQRMHDAVNHELNADFDRAVEISKNIWPKGARAGEDRLVLQKAWSEVAVYNYERLSLGE